MIDTLLALFWPVVLAFFFLRYVVSAALIWKDSKA